MSNPLSDHLHLCRPPPEPYRGPRTLEEMERAHRERQARKAAQAVPMARETAICEVQHERTKIDQWQSLAMEWSILISASIPALIAQRRAEGYSDWRWLIGETAREFGLTLDDLTGRRRTAPIVEARQEAIYRLKREAPNLSLPHIGRLFGRDHTTILHALRKMAKKHSETVK